MAALGRGSCGHHRVDATDDVLGLAQRRALELCLEAGDRGRVLVLKQSDHRLAQPRARLSHLERVVVVRARRYHRRCALRRVLALEYAAADEDAVTAQLHEQADVGGRGEASRGESDHWQAAGVTDLLDQLDRHTELLGIGEDLVVAQRTQLTDLREDGAGVAHRLDDVACASVSFEADHGCPLCNAAQRLTQVLRPAHKWYLEVALVDVVRLIRSCEHFRLVDAIDLQGLEDL
mmetsp:Transcript_18208/g.37084  ORF Transcript_18208/g.37084 Transcript_18208/m.37084 type:complete len:234 (+) Transcript_18208:279-980(+)